MNIQKEGAVSRAVRRLWDSSTAMSWFSVASRTLGAFVVLPLLLTRFSAEEISVWYLLATLIGLQQLADMGFAPTFVRVISFALGGADDLRTGKREPGSSAEANWTAVEQIWQTMFVVYNQLTIASFALFGVAGTLSLVRPIGASGEPSQSWAAWATIVVTFALSMRGNAYAAYLQGMGRVALVRRWEALTALAGAITSIAVLLAGGGIFALVAANQAWVVVGIVRNRWLARGLNNSRARSFADGAASPVVLDAVWGSAMRSGLGVIFSRGVLLSSGLVYAQVADPKSLAAYLLAFRVVQLMLDFSNAPFYSKLPQLAMLRAEGSNDRLAKIAERGMSTSYWTFALGFVSVGLLAPAILRLLGSSVPWVDSGLWALLGVAYLIERFGAMHIQLYSTTNHIIWHTANGVSGSLYVIMSLALLPRIGVYAFPLAIALSYVSFYSWYGPLHVARAFDFEFWGFQRRTVLVPALIVAAYATVVGAGIFIP